MNTAADNRAQWSNGKNGIGYYLLVHIYYSCLYVKCDILFKKSDFCAVVTYCFYHWKNNAIALLLQTVYL